MSLRELSWHLGLYTLAIVVGIWAHARDRASHPEGTSFFVLAVGLICLGLLLEA